MTSTRNFNETSAFTLGLNFMSIDHLTQKIEELESSTYHIFSKSSHTYFSEAEIALQSFDENS